MSDKQLQKLIDCYERLDLLIYGVGAGSREDVDEYYDLHRKLEILIGYEYEI